MNRKELLVKGAQLAPIGLLAACTRSIVPPFVPGSPGISDLLALDKRYRPGQGFHAGKYYFDAQWYEPHEFPGLIYWAIGNTELKRGVGQWYCNPLTSECYLDMECKECCGAGGLMYDCTFSKSFTFDPGSNVWTKGHVLNIFGNYFHVAIPAIPTIRSAVRSDDRATAKRSSSPRRSMKAMPTCINTIPRRSRLPRKSRTWANTKERTAPTTATFMGRCKSRSGLPLASLA